MKCQLKTFDDTFFQDGAPFFGPVENLRFKFRGKVTDKTGQLAVTVWTEPAEEMLQISSDALAALWYEIGAAADPQAAQEGFLEKLNKNREDAYGEDQCGVQVNVNTTDPVTIAA